MAITIYIKLYKQVKTEELETHKQYNNDNLWENKYYSKHYKCYDSINFLTLDKNKTNWAECVYIYFVISF